MDTNYLIQYLLSMLHGRPEQDVRVNDLNFLLYDAWVNYHKDTGLSLFDEWFIVQDCGPVHPLIKKKYGSINRVVITKAKRPPISEPSVERAVILAIQNYYSNPDARKPEYRKAWVRAYHEMQEDKDRCSSASATVYHIPPGFIIEDDCHQMKSGIVICVDFYDGKSTIPHYFKVPDGNFDLEAGLKDAVREFASTPDGKDFMNEFYSFNWADIEEHLSPELLHKHHIEIVKPYSLSLTVNPDRAILCDSELEEEN